MRNPLILFIVFAFAVGAALPKLALQSKRADAHSGQLLTKGPSGFYEASATIENIELRCRYYWKLPRRGSYLTTYVPCRPISDIASTFQRDSDDVLFRKSLVAEIKLKSSQMPQQAFILLAQHHVLDPIAVSPAPRNSRYAKSLSVGDEIVAGFWNSRGSNYDVIAKFVRHE